MKFEKIFGVVVIIIVCLSIVNFFINMDMLLPTNENEDTKITMPTTYEVSAIVDQISQEESLVLFVDWNGEAWYYETESKNFFIGQLVIIEFDSMGTSNIYDDEIVKIRS